MVLLAVASVAAVLQRRLRGFPLVWAGLLLPPLIYLAVSMTSALNIGMRHILPVYPFVYVAAAGLLAQLSVRRWARHAMLALGVLQAAECAVIAPHYLAFFNALAGGPRNGPRYLADSNIDWGQDLKNLVDWLHAHGAADAWCSYFGSAPMEYYGLRYHDLPAAGDRDAWNRIDGFVAVSATVLAGVYTPPEDTARLRAMEPAARVGWSIFVYDWRKPHAGGEHRGETTRPARTR
jgi:hypothetical protein